jgi:hypothetical protein
MYSGPSLIEELGLDEKSLTWRHLSLCGGRSRGEGMPLKWFFEDYENDPEHAKAMDTICLSCPVMKQCLADGIENGDYGLRGAIFLSNGKKDNQKNSHKTPEVWKRIEEKLSA